MLRGVRAHWARAGRGLHGLEQLLTRLITSPRVRWPAMLTITAFLTVQACSVAFQSMLPSKLKSGFGFNLPWQMFATPPPFSPFLEATAITATGERLTIPVHNEIFTHYRGLSQIRAFEEATWLMSPPGRGDDERKRALAIYLRDRLRGWGIDARVIELRFKAIPNDESEGPIQYFLIGRFEMPPLPPVPPYFQMPPPDPRIPW